MNTSIVSPEALSPEQVRLWCEWQRADSSLHSPFLRPEYAQQVGAVLPGVAVALLQEDGETAGFFPFQRGTGRVGGPVGGPLCDFQGVVARPGTTFDPKQLVRGCGLNAWHFHHLLGTQTPFQPYHYCDSPSRYMDLAGGFEAYCSDRSRSGSQQVRKFQQRARKMARELGPLRLVPHSTDRQMFETLVRWKVEHYRRIKAINYLGDDWVRQLLRRLLELRDDCFCGMLSVLYCGERLVAVHLGVRSCEILHSWFPTYDPELADYSPGSVLFLQLAEAAPRLGLRRIDLGRGDEQFKLGLGTASVPVAQGSVDCRLMANGMRRGAFHFFRWLRSSRLRAAAKRVGRRFPALRRWATFHE